MSKLALEELKKRPLNSLRPRQRPRKEVSAYFIKGRRHYLIIYFGPHTALRYKLKVQSFGCSEPAHLCCSGLLGCGRLPLAAQRGDGSKSSHFFLNSSGSPKKLAKCLKKICILAMHIVNSLFQADLEYKPTASN